MSVPDHSIPNHSDREHAHWSSSATARNWTCAGALAMETISPDDKESIHAARGTAAHTIAERAIRAGEDCDAYEGQIINTTSHEIEIDKELVDSAQVYVDYVNNLIMPPDDKGDASDGDSWWAVEQKYSMAILNPPFDAGGTTDFMHANFITRTLEIADFKNGMMGVEVNGNKQGRSYGVLGLINLPPEIAARIDKVKVTIVQPRAPHPDGVIRSEEFHVADLVGWAGELLKAMHRSRAAWDAFHALDGQRASFDAWCSTYLTPGNCVFCRAEATCPALKAKAMTIIPETLKAFFEDPDSPQPTFVANAPDLMNAVELERILDGLELLEGWVKAVRGHAHNLAERGTKFDHWVLGEKISNRAWAADEAKVVADLKSVVKLTDEQIYKRKLASPAQVEKIIGAKRKGEISNMTHRRVTGTNLASVEKTTRTPVLSKPEKFFEQPED